LGTPYGACRFIARCSLVVMAAIGLSMAAAPAVASAQVPGQDSVSGAAATGTGRAFTRFTFDVRSGPSGESPTGTVALDTFFGLIGPLDVTCLTVGGNRASMFAEAPPNTSDVAGLSISVEDNGPAGDMIDWRTVPVVPTDCPVPSQVLDATVSGDITVTDAQPLPTSKAQCTNNGWRTYGTFKDQLHCVRYVRLKARVNCQAERAAIGISAFRAKYGITFAMRNCIWRTILF
jgi:hypothetical protein